MLTTIADAIEARLKSLGCFKTVEQSITKRALSAPPSAVFYLAAFKGVGDKPHVAKDLTWEIAIMASALGADKGQATALECIETTVKGFTNWQPDITGMKPAAAPDFQLEGFEETLIIYTGRITIRAFIA